MDVKTRDFLIRNLRLLSLKSGHRSAAKKIRYRGPATFECDKCGTYCYEGNRPLDKIKEFFALQNKFPKIISEEIEMDHQTPCVPLQGFKSGLLINGSYFDFNIYLNNMFVHSSKFNALCSVCHLQKTNLERAER